MDTLTEIETAFKQLPVVQLEALHLSLGSRLKRDAFLRDAAEGGPVSVLDIPAVSLGAVLMPLASRDDFFPD